MVYSRSGMFYHLRIVRQRDKKSTVKLDLTEDQLEERVLAPHRTGAPFMLSGEVHHWHDIERIRINRTEEPSEVLRPVVKAERERIERESPVVVIGGPGLDWYIAESGEDVTDEVLTRPPGSQAPPLPDVERVNSIDPDPRNVMVVHGRDDRLRDSMFALLRSLGLNPLEWSSLRAATNKSSPYVGEILDAAFAQAAAVVVLLTGDDEARLREVFHTDNEPDYESKLTPQARPNVLFEAGMALASHPDRTVVVEVGDLRPFSDIAGRHVVRMTNDADQRIDLAQRLETAGCTVDMTGTDWLKVGDFAS